MKIGTILGAILGVILLIATLMMVNINDAGERTVVQYPSGKTWVQMQPGWYLTHFGTTWVYDDVITYDFEQGNNPSDPTVDVDGIDVRYQDGGLGSIHGIARFQLPATEAEMIKIHKEFQSNEGLAFKLLKNATREAMNLTAGLMASEDAYAVKRNQYADWARDQLENGKYRTVQREVSEIDEATGKRVIRTIPEIAYSMVTDTECLATYEAPEDVTGKALSAARSKACPKVRGEPQQDVSDLDRYGISISSLQITDWGFEAKTLQQITDKREATMAIITAKANADRAVQDAITAEEQGKAKVMTAKYEQEVEKEKRVVIAEREKEVAEIAAAQKVAVAAQGRLEAEQKKLQAIEYKEEQILIGEGDGERKRLVMEADGALAQKLEAWVVVNENYAKEFGKQKWVPEMQFGAGGEGGTAGNTVQDFISLMTVSTAKDIDLDNKVRSNK